MRAARVEASTEPAFHHALIRLLTDLPSATALELHLLATLRLFLPLGSLWIIWLPGTELLDAAQLAGLAGGARSEHLDDVPRLMTDEEIADLLPLRRAPAADAESALDDPPSARRTSDLTVVPLKLDEAREWGISIRRDGPVRADRGAELLVGLHKEDSPKWQLVASRCLWLATNEAAFSSLFTAFEGLKDLESQRKALEKQYFLMMQIQQLSTLHGIPTRERLARASTLATDLLTSSALAARYPMQLRLAVELGEAVLQETLGAGLDLQRPSPTPGAGHVLAEKLVAIASRGLAEGEDGTLQVLQARLTRLAETLRCITWAAELPASSKRPPRLPTLLVAIDERLAVWTRLEQQAMALPENGPDDDEVRWRDAARQELVPLGQVLKGRSQEHIDTLYLPSWLRLWLCHELMWNAFRGEQPRWKVMAPAQRMKLWRALAYVTRESIRVFNYGHRSDYLFHTRVFTKSLLRLVEYHARAVAGVPVEVDIRGFVAELGRSPSPTDDRFAIGHPQHALEVYAAGNFLSSLQVTDPQGAASTLGIELAAGVDPGAFTTAFALAALLHDVGHLLFSEGSADRLVERLDNAEIRQQFRKFANDARDGRASFLNGALQELRHPDNGYVGPDEPALLRWVEERAKRGDPDHCLVGAWYLHHLCRKVPALRSKTAIVKQVVRATLLHRIPTQVIDLRQDPVAGLLVLCDELFEWSPTDRGSHHAVATGRAFYSLAAEVRPQASRFRTIQVHGLDIEVGEEGRVHPRLRRQPGQWLRFDMALQSAEYLNCPVHHAWLSMTQNLERLKRDGGAPTMVVTAPPGDPSTGAPLVRNSLAHAAERAGGKLGTTLDSWVTDTTRFPEGGGADELHVECRGLCWYDGDIREAFGDIDAAVTGPHAGAEDGANPGLD